MLFDVKLTKRETQVMELLFLGQSAKEIAALLPGREVAVKTVNNILDNMRRKIRVQKNTELILWWVITHFKITVDFSPLRRKICAGMLLILLVPEVLFLSVDMVRSCRSGKEASRTASGRARKSKKDDYIELF